MCFLYRKVPAGRSKFPHSTCDLAPGEVRAAESRPALEKRGVWFLSLQPSSVRCYRGLQHFGGGGERISPDCPCHVICLACALALPSPCFSTLVSFAWALELEVAGEVACVISGRWATCPHPTAQGGRGSVGRLLRVPETLGSGQLGLSGHRCSRGVRNRGVPSKRAQESLRFPLEPPGGGPQARGSSCFLH